MERQWLKQLRIEAGYKKQKDFAEKLGIYKSYLSEIEKGSRTPSGKLAFRIAQELDFKMERFFEDEKEYA